jgi:hypothetical protein
MSRFPPLADEVARIKAAFPSEWRDGARCAFFRKFEGERDMGGYPKGFNHWSLDRRNAWFSGFNQGFHDRFLFAKQVEEER